MNILKQVIKGLTSNLGRTLLTTLGIVIGIAMVIIVLSAGEGFRSFIVDQVESFGTNTVFIETRVPPTTKARNSGGSNSFNSGAGSQAVQITSLKQRDVEEIKRLNNVTGAYGMVIGQKVAAYKDVKKNALIWGADASRFEIDRGELSSGRFYSATENSAAAQVIILGHGIAADLFKDEDPLGKTVRLDRFNFLVIGVYEKKGGFNNEDQSVYIPLETAQKKLLGIDHLFMIIAQVGNTDMAEATAEDIRITLRSNHSIEDPAKDDFLVQTQASSLNTFSVILSGISFLLIAIAAISLVVGGVGIMNIMYVVVTERTAEVGLKKALGARDGDILTEFLLESVIITLAGGLFGIILGSGLSFLVAQIASSMGFAWKFVVPPVSIIISLGVAAGIGIIFGVFPARRAGKLNPIEALRYE